MKIFWLYYKRCDNQILSVNLYNLPYYIIPWKLYFIFKYIEWNACGNRHSIAACTCCISAFRWTGKNLPDFWCSPPSAEQRWIMLRQILRKRLQSSGTAAVIVIVATITSCGRTPSWGAVCFIDIKSQSYAGSSIPAGLDNCFPISHHVGKGTTAVVVVAASADSCASSPSQNEFHTISIPCQRRGESPHSWCWP